MARIVQILFSRQELDAVRDIIPYPVKSIVDPGEIAFPAVVKFLLLTEMNNGQEEQIVYVIPFDAEDLLTFYETIAEKLELNKREGIDGYDYAEADVGAERAPIEYAEGEIDYREHDAAAWEENEDQFWAALDNDDAVGRETSETRGLGEQAGEA